MKPLDALRRTRWLGALLLSAGLAACNGGDDPPPTPTPTGVSGSLAGTAATGAAISGGTVEVKCAAGPDPTPATTSAAGAWTVTVSGVTLPCKVKVSGGNLPSGAAFHSIAVDLGTVNVTPLTDLVVANLTGQNPATWYAGVTPADLGKITASAVNTAVGNVRTAINVAAFGASVNPLTTALAIGDAVDKILDALKVAVPDYAALLTAAQGQSFASTFASTYATALNNALSGGGTGGGGTGGGGTGGGTDALLAAANCSPGITTGFSLVAEVTVAGVASVPVCVDGLSTKPATQSEFCGNTQFQQGLPPGISINSCSYNPTTGVADVTATLAAGPVSTSYTVKYTFIARTGGGGTGGTGGGGTGGGGTGPTLTCDLSNFPPGIPSGAVRTPTAQELALYVKTYPSGSLFDETKALSTMVSATLQSDGLLILDGKTLTPTSVCYDTTIGDVNYGNTLYVHFSGGKADLWEKASTFAATYSIPKFSTNTVDAVLASLNTAACTVSAPQGNGTNYTLCTGAVVSDFRLDGPDCIVWKSGSTVSLTNYSKVISAQLDGGDFDTANNQPNMLELLAYDGSGNALTNVSMTLQRSASGPTRVNVSANTPNPAGGFSAITCAAF